MKETEANLNYEGNMLLLEDHLSKKPSVVVLLVCKILVEVCFDLKNTQVLSYWNLVLLTNGEGSTLPVFPATKILPLFTAKLSTLDIFSYLTAYNYQENNKKTSCCKEN